MDFCDNTDIFYALKRPSEVTHPRGLLLGITKSSMFFLNRKSNKAFYFRYTSWFSYPLKGDVNRALLYAK